MRPLNTLYLLLLLGTAACCIIGCGADRQAIVALDDIEANYEVYNIFAAMDSLNAQHAPTTIDALMDAHPEYMQLVLKKLYQLQTKDSSDLTAQLIDWRKSDRVNYFFHLIDSVQLDFSDTQAIDRLYKHMVYYFGNTQMPNLYYGMHDLAVDLFLFTDEEGKEGIGIGEDMFLGPYFNYSLLERFDPIFSDYNSRFFDQDHLPKKIGQLLMEDRIPKKKTDIVFLDQLVFEGKVMYMLELLMPQTPDTIVWSYTQAQLDWVKANERNIYSFLIEDNKLYARNSTLLAKYLKPAPSSYGMPPEAPGRAAVYIGYQIVRAYMSKVGMDGLDEMLKELDGQTILQKSRYKPALD